MRGGSSGEIWPVAPEELGHRLRVRRQFRSAGFAEVDAEEHQRLGPQPHRRPAGRTGEREQLRPEIVIGYVVLLDVVEDKARKEDREMWSDWFEQALRRLAIRKAPLWNPG